MLPIVWFLVWGIAYQQSAPPETRISTTQLYQQAVTELQSPAPLSAIPTLLRLASDKDSKLAPLAAVRLAECYLANNQTVEALELLVHWTPHALKLPKQALALKLDPDIALRASQLTRSALAQLPDANTPLIEQYIQQRAAVHSQLEPVDVWLLSELARRYAAQQRYRDAYETLQKLGSLADAQAVKLREYDLPISIAISDPSVDLLERFVDFIERSNQLSQSELVSAQFAVAEGYLKLKDLEKASSTLKRLRETLQSQGAGTQNSSTAATQWLATADLRLTEIMVLQGQHRAAAQQAEELLLKHANYSDLSHFRLVAARCYVAEIEFDRANSHLKEIPLDPHSKPAQIAQSLWMRGEICVLERNYSAAIEHYANVLEVSEQPLWHARALLQMAKCHEIQAAPLEAMIAYRAIVDKYAQSELAPLAKARLTEILPDLSPTPAPLESANQTGDPNISQTSETTTLTIQR